eukprot:379249-Hanusia_phi.AAC.1
MRTYLKTLLPSSKVESDVASQVANTYVLSLNFNNPENANEIKADSFLVNASSSCVFIARIFFEVFPPQHLVENVGASP